MGTIITCISRIDWESFLRLLCTCKISCHEQSSRRFWRITTTSTRKLSKILLVLILTKTSSSVAILSCILLLLLLECRSRLHSSQRIDGLSTSKIQSWGTIHHLFFHWIVDQSCSVRVALTESSLSCADSCCIWLPIRSICLVLNSYCGITGSACKVTLWHKAILS